MFRFVFRMVFRAITLVILAGTAFVLYHLYESGQLPFIQRAIEDTAVTASVRAGFAIHRDLADRPIHVSTGLSGTGSMWITRLALAYS